MRVEVAQYAGYCYGVERALKLTQEAIGASPKPIYTLGPIIHNPVVVETLKSSGIFPVEDVSEVKEGTVIIRSHGVDPKVIKDLRKRGIKVIDATCPFVKKAQKRAALLIKEGYFLVVVGERNHPEVIGILAHAGGKALVTESTVREVDFPKGKKVGVVVQTTQSVKNLERVVGSLLPFSSEVRVFNTICDATLKRQEAAKELARRADVMIVVGGKNSANTTRLTRICRAMGTPTYHIEKASEINPSWFKKNYLVGVTAGASTPDELLEEVVKKLNSFK